MRELCEAVARRLVPFDTGGDEAAAAALCYVARRLATAESGTREAFEAGLASLEALAHAECGGPFIELDVARQDAWLTALAAGHFSAAWPEGAAWFERLVRWVAEAAYAEPGGLRARAWSALGYPERVRPSIVVQGPRRAPRGAAPSSYDAIVVGAGVAGSIVTGVLARSGFRVLLLERGDDATARALEQNHLENHRLSLYGHNTGPALDGNPRVLVDARGRRHVLRPHDRGYHNNAVGVGGGGLVFGAMAWRFHPHDFAMASRYGVPGGSSLADWPLRYDDLAPFYARIEHDVGVAAEPGARVGATHADYPMPPHAGHPGRAVLRRGALELGWRPHGVPLAINSVPRHGRARAWAAARASASRAPPARRTAATTLCSSRAWTARASRSAPSRRSCP